MALACFLKLSVTTTLKFTEKIFSRLQFDFSLLMLFHLFQRKLQIFNKYLMLFRKMLNFLETKIIYQLHKEILFVVGYVDYYSLHNCFIYQQMPARSCNQRVSGTNTKLRDNNVINKQNFLCLVLIAVESVYECYTKNLL